MLVHLRRHADLADPAEQVTRGDCSNKAAIQDYAGHGTHTAGTIASPINGIGIAGVAPEATIVALKAGTAEGYFFTQSVVDALRYAGDQRLDVVNMSFFADPWLFNCRNNKEQKAIIQAISAAARYAEQRGVVLVAAAGNEGIDLNHPVTDEISPDFPPGAAVTRPVNNNCVVLPTELPGVVVVSATGAQNLLVLVLDVRQHHRRGGAGWLALPDADVRLGARARARAVLLDGSATWPLRRPSGGWSSGPERQLLRVAERDLDGGAARGRRGGADPGGASRDVAGSGRGAAAQHARPAWLSERARPGRRRSSARRSRSARAVTAATTSTAPGS